VLLFSLSLRRSALAAVAALLLVLPAGAPPAAARPAPDSFADLADKLLPSVVNISTTQTLKTDKQKESTPGRPKFPPGSPFEEFFKDFFKDHDTPQSGRPEAKPRKATSLGSGFVVDAGGYIVTNNHVIADADEITVKLADNTELKAEVVGRDTKTDVAVLKVKTTKPLVATRWGDSDKSRVGDWVLAIGNPFGLGGSVTAGILSARQRDIQSGPYDDFLQTDAAINRGNSGGPMFNMDGEVIGINTAIYSPSGGSIGIGFAIPSAMAQPIIEQLKATGKVERGWIGARIQPVTDEIAESLGLEKNRGAMIAAVDWASPAEKAKLQPGDLILSYDGKPIERSRQLPCLVADTPPDKQVKLTIWRDGKEQEVELKAAALNPNRPAPPPPDPEKPKSPPSVEALGVKLAKLTPDLRKQFSLSDGAKGAVIIEVPQNSPAANQGLRAGDLLVAVGRSAVANPEDVPQLIAGARKNGHRNVLVRVEREGSSRFVALPVETG